MNRPGSSDSVREQSGRGSFSSWGRNRISPTALLISSVFLTLVLLVWLLHGTYVTHRDGLIAQERRHRMEVLKDLLAESDLSLDMSVRLNVLTTDSQWKTLYHKFEAQRDAAIADLMAFIPEPNRAEIAKKIDAVGRALTIPEHRALDLVGQGLQDEALFALEDDEYQLRRGAYTHVLEEFLSSVDEYGRAARPPRETNVLLRQSAAVASVFLLLVLWLAVRRRRRIEEERLRSAQTGELLTSISSVLIGVGADDRVMNWNAAAEKLFGITAASTIGRPFRNCGIRWDWSTILDKISECLKNNRSSRIEAIRYDRPDGGEGVLGATVHPISAHSTATSGFLLLAADLTEQVHLENQLLQAQKLESVGQLAAGIAHEINTPTQYVGDNTRFLQEAFGEVLDLTRKVDALTEAASSESGQSELAAEIREAMNKVDLKFLNEEIPQAIQQALEGVDRVTKIVRAMKEFSHPMKDRTAIDINRAIESTITVARNEWKYVAEMVTDLDAELPPVVCLPGLFNQVILNLIVNAAHAISEVVDDGASSKGTITVSTRHTDGWAEIRITDTGTGISDEIRDKIFDPFFTTKDVGKGTGQGLSLVHSVVVQKHGGEISIDTEVGKGTSFLIRLPLNEEEAVETEGVA